MHRTRLITLSIFIALAVPLSGCSKQALYRALFEAGQSYDCDARPAIGADHQHPQRCLDPTFGGDRQRYDDFESIRDDELGEQRPTS